MWRRLWTFGGPGGDRLSHVLRRSTIGAEVFHGRVRDGIGCWGPRYGHQVGGTSVVRKCDDVGMGMDPWGMCLISRWFPLRAGLTLVPAFGAGDLRRGWDQAGRAISKAQLHALLRVHMPPIDVMVYHGSSGKAGFEGGFPLRCFQRLSRPHIATRRCHWRDNRYTRGASIPVLSY